MGSGVSFALTMDTIAEFIIHPSFVWMWCIMTGFYALQSLLSFKWQSSRIANQLLGATNYLKSYTSTNHFASDFGSFSLKLEAADRLKRAWQDFHQSLIFPEADNKDTLGEAIKCPRETRDFFSSQTIIEPYIDLKTYDAVPTQLCGFGILGTFTGLSFGIFLARGGLAGGDMLAIQSALNQLLSGASLAFWTSIVGIASSIIFTRLEKAMLNSLVQKVARFNDALAPLIATISLEEISKRQLGYSKMHDDKLKSAVETLTEIQKSRSETNEKLVLDVVREFKSAMSEALSIEIVNIAQSLKQINQALNLTKDAVEKTGKSFGDISDQSAKFFKKNLHELTHQFQSNFRQSTEAVQSSFKEATKDLSLVLENSAKSMEASLKRPCVEFAETMKQFSQNVNKTNDAWVVATNTNLTQSKHVLKSHQQLSEYIIPLLQTSKTISAASIETQNALKESNDAAKFIAVNVKHIEGTNREMVKLMDEYNRRFKDIDDNLQRAFVQTSQNLNLYSDKVKDFTSELDKHMSKGMVSLASAVGDLSEVLRRSPAPMIHRVTGLEAHDNGQGSV